MTGVYYGLPNVILPDEEPPKGALEAERQQEESQRIIPEHEIFDKSQKDNVKVKIEKRVKKQEELPKEEKDDDYLIEEIEMEKQTEEEKKRQRV